MNIDKIDPELIGNYLLQRGFKDFFLYLFKIVEGRSFLQDPMHQDLFDVFEDIYTTKEKRVIINIAPRSAKTTLNKYFIVYCWTKNPKCNFIYTSYSEDLLRNIARELALILEHPVYKAMFPHRRYDKEEVIEKPVDDFWAEYLEKETGHNIYSSKKIITYKGGICLFSAMGAQITGYGSGIRNATNFSGALIIDDPNKPADVRSSIIRERVLRYYEETLLSRLNNSDVPIICVQQRLHVLDLTGQLEEKYNFKKISKPLLDELGKCQLPSQYSDERIKELQINNYLFQSQFMQSPIYPGGQVIKREWFGYYPTNTKYIYKQIVIAADTAISAKEHADYTCFLVGGITEQNKLHILEMVHGKWEYPELKQQAISIFNRWQLDKRETSASSFCIENRASGQQLIQDFKNSGLPIKSIDVTKDKLSRVEEVLDYIANGSILLPENESYSNNQVLLSECESFTRDLTAPHDDIVDTLCHLINNTIAKRQISILEVL